MSKITGLRVLFALSIALANVLVFAAATPDAKQSCYKCVAVPGGVGGWYAQCQPNGTTLDLCLYTTITHCYGYRCGQPWGEEEEFDPEEPY